MHINKRISFILVFIVAFCGVFVDIVLRVRLHASKVAGAPEKRRRSGRRRSSGAAELLAKAKEHKSKFIGVIVGIVLNFTVSLLYPLVIIPGGKAGSL